MSDTIKTALVTGGSMGIGYGVAEALINQGIKVAVTSRSQENADEAAASLNKIKDGYALGLVADVRSLTAQEKAVEEILDKWGSAGLRHR